MCAGTCKCKERKEIAKGKLEQAKELLKQLKIFEKTYPEFKANRERKNEIETLIEQAIELI